MRRFPLTLPIKFLYIIVYSSKLCFLTFPMHFTRAVNVSLQKELGEAYSHR